MIDSIELVNWKTHSSTKLAFAKGTNILIGQMGAGKSSVMDAISFGLFGTFPALKSRRVGVDGLIKNRPEQEKGAKLKLSFKVGEDSYTVEREVSLDGSAKATLEKNGAYVQSQPQRVTEEIERVLSVDYDLFSRAIYSEQNRLDYFLELNASSRKKQIDSLLGLDKFATALENGVSLANRIKDAMEDEKRAAESFDAEGQKKLLAKLESEMAKLSEEKKESEEKLAKLKEKSDKAGRGLKKMKEEYGKKLLLTREMAELKSRFEVTKKEVGKIDAQNLPGIDEVKRKLKEIEPETEALRSGRKEAMAGMETAQKGLGKAQNELSSIDKDIAKREKLIGSVKGKERLKVSEELERHKKESERIEGELAAAEAQGSEASKWIKELEKHISKCPVCERDLEPKMRDALLQAKKALADGLAAKAKGMQEDKKKNTQKVVELTELLNRITVVEEGLKSLAGLEEKKIRAEGNSKKFTEECAGKKKEIEKIDEEINAANLEQSRLKAAKESLERKASYLEEMENVEKEMAKKRSESEGIKIDDQKLDEVQKEFTAISAEVSGYAASLEANGRAIAEKRTQIGDRKKEMEKIEALYEQAKKKKAAVDNLIKFNNALQDTQAQLRARLVSSINSIMSEIWPELYPYSDYTGLELSAAEDDYVLKVKTANGWQDVDAIASGGERSIACLAMRVAFALVLVPNLRWLILDEPTHNIDQLGIERFVSVFNERLPKIVDQIFIITHDEQLKQVSNGKIYMFSRDKAAGGGTVAEEI